MHFMKFLMDNNAFNQKFINDVTTSKKLNNNIEEDKFFYSMEEMKDYYNNLLSDDELALEKEYNTKLWNAILDERYEEAARLRDHMLKNNIRIDQKND